MLESLLESFLVTFLVPNSGGGVCVFGKYVDLGVLHQFSQLAANNQMFRKSSIRTM